MKQAEMIGEDTGSIYLNSFRFLTKYFFIWHTFCTFVTDGTNPNDESMKLHSYPLPGVEAINSFIYAYYRTGEY